MKSTRRYLLSALSAAFLLVACGGGGDKGDSHATPKPTFTRVVTFGDSLADVGTFGMKFTIRNADAGTWFPVFPELVAADVGTTQCPYHRATAMSTYATDPACSNFAVGGGRLMNPASQGGDLAPQHIPRQFATAAGVVGGYRATDLVLIDGGGNDVSDLVAAYLNPSTLRGFLLQQIDSATLDGLLAQPNGAATAAGVYMQHLAATLYDSIGANLLDKGAVHVVVLDIPDITRTPRLQAVLGQVAITQGQAAAQALQATIRQWIRAYNEQLHQLDGIESRMVVVRFHDALDTELTYPANFGLTNVTQAACPATGMDTTGLPSYDFTTCTSAALDAAPPQGLSAGWWNTWAFSDGFHPTPRGHELLADNVRRALAGARWR